MTEGRLNAAGAVVFLDGLLARLESLLSRVGEMKASGEMTPELEAKIESRLSWLRTLLPAIRESVDPSSAPMLRIKRVARAKALAMRSNGVPDDEIRSAFEGLIERTECLLSGAEHAHLGPQVMAAVDEVLSDVGEA